MYTHGSRRMPDTGSMKSVPLHYTPGYKQARALDWVMADLYAEHTMVGDPLADAVRDSEATFR